VSLRFSNDLEWLGEIFNDTKHARTLCNSWASCYMIVAARWLSVLHADCEVKQRVNRVASSCFFHLRHVSNSSAVFASDTVALMLTMLDCCNSVHAVLAWSTVPLHAAARLVPGMDSYIMSWACRHVITLVRQLHSWNLLSWCIRSTLGSGQSAAWQSIRIRFIFHHGGAIVEGRGDHERQIVWTKPPDPYYRATKSRFGPNIFPWRPLCRRLYAPPTSTMPWTVFCVAGHYL